MNKSNVYWIDLFCGAGGTSTGLHLAGHTVIACVNHDKNAIEAHKSNHPNTEHFMEDVRDQSVVLKLKILVDNLRRTNPYAKVGLWASLECTNFSIAKGGKPKDADSRTLANSMFNYIKLLKPDIFWVENVKEFLSWGPLCEKGKPISKESGIDYLRWKRRIELLGYSYEHRILNSADYGSCQSRKRLFIQFCAEGLIHVWPTQTHIKFNNENCLFPLPKWRAVKEVLDLDDEGKSIFSRKKPLSDRTMSVILKGISKAIAENKNVFLYKYYSNGTNYNSIDSPCGTLTTKDRFAKVTLIFNQYKTGSISSIDIPNGTLTTTPKQNLLSFILNPSHGGHTTSIENPSPTIIARQDKAPLYLIKAYMEDHGIVDIKMRMLKIEELLQIQGFPKNYKLKGTQADQKKQIGNAVDVFQSYAIAKCISYRFNQAIRSA